MELIQITVITVLSLAVAIFVFSWITKYSDMLCKAPGLDLTVSVFTWIPWVLAWREAGIAGFGASLIGQLIVLYLFNYVHAKIIMRYKGPTLEAALNKVVGFSRNHIGLFISLGALPFFLMLRLGEILLYNPLVWTLGFPKYKVSEWINVSRFKFDGLVGHDMVWCLYCDWMTGIYSLGAEMLRNVESFWCPIRFYEGKKCDNCKVDFPDLDKWVPADGKMPDVVDLILEKYPPESKADRSWFGHPERT